MAEVQVDAQLMDHADMITAYLEYLRRKSASDTTIRLRSTVLRLLNRELRRGVGETDREELERWLHRDRQPAWSKNTKATYFRALKSVYGFWANPRDPWIDHDPTEDMDPVRGKPGVSNPVTDAQLQIILTRAAQPYRRWALIAAYQGLRCGEISGLDREHITEERLLVAVAKGGRPRVHDTHEDVWAAVKDLPPGPIARNSRGERASADMVSLMAARHFQRVLGLEKVTMHMLRHWLGETTQRLYRDIRVTQKMLGHRSILSTQIYTAATDQQQRAARSLLPRLAG